MVKTVKYRVARSRLTHLITHFFPTLGVGGRVYKHQERDDVMAFQNLFSDDGSVEHAAGQ